jgi:two-component system sensor histidine kinase HydH
VLAVFWLDVKTPAVVTIPMFYVVPTLLFMWAGRPWEPFVVAAVATALTAVGLYTDAEEDPAIAVLNRSVEVIGIWMAAAVVGVFRVMAGRWKEAEARLREQAALTQLGQLAAVVAHEVRNPLAGVRGTLQVLESRVPGQVCDRAVITTMIERLDALNAKVTDLLVYARPSEPKLQAVDPRPIIADAAANARAAAGVGAVSTLVSGDGALVRADPECLRSVLLNLLLNAYQADGTQPVEVDVSRQDGSCTIAVLDRGPGIPAHVRARLFEPFFTTKPAGTGLGLPVVKRLMELQGGSIRLIDRAGGGTRAEISLPEA